MKKVMTLIATLSLLSGMTLPFTTMENANANEVDQILRETNQLIQEAERFHDNVLVPGQIRYQNYLNSLFAQCIRGNQRACGEYNVRINRLNSQLNQAIFVQRYRNFLRNYY